MLVTETKIVFVTNYINSIKYRDFDFIHIFIQE